MRSSGKGSGGGIGNNKIVRQGMKQGAPARHMREKGVSQIGTSRGNHATTSGKMLRGDQEPVQGKVKPQGSPGTIPLGNRVAEQTVCGPGGSRTVMPAGGQGVQGPDNKH